MNLVSQPIDRPMRDQMRLTHMLAKFYNPSFFLFNSVWLQIVNFIFYYTFFIIIFLFVRLFVKLRNYMRLNLLVFGHDSQRAKERWRQWEKGSKQNKYTIWSYIYCLVHLYLHEHLLLLFLLRSFFLVVLLL